MAEYVMGNYPDKDLLERLWKSGMRAKEILEYLDEHGLPTVSYASLGKYGQRWWNDESKKGKKAVENFMKVSEVEDLVESIKDSDIGDVSRISFSKSGYSISVAPKPEIEEIDLIAELPRIDSKAARKRSKKSKNTNEPATHIIIPDTQIEPGRDWSHIKWIAQYINDHYSLTQNLKTIHLGDHWNMGSLSSYDKGKGSMEGRRYLADIEIGNESFEPLTKLPEQSENHFILGNHEQRADRAANSDIQLEGLITTDHMLTPGWIRHQFLDVVDLDGISYCLTPDHRVLNADLNYIPLGEVKVGDKLLAFDEYKKLGNNHRKYRESIVLAADPIKAPVYRITLESGKVFRSTADHRWLARKYYTTQYDWIATKDLKVNSSAICRPFPEWDELNTKEAGYLAGIFDGEGHVSKSNQGQGGLQLGFSQNDNIVLEKSLLILEKLGYKYNIHWPSEDSEESCGKVYILGSIGDKLKLMGSIGTHRLIKKLQSKFDSLGRVQSGDSYPTDRVVDVTYEGEQEVIQLATSTETFIADGYASHNCHYFYNPNTGKSYGDNIESRLKTLGRSFVQGHQQGLKFANRFINGVQQIGIVAGSCYIHEENYMGPQGTGYWRGIVILNNVENGEADPEFISLDQLCRMYEGISLVEYTSA